MSLKLKFGGQMLTIGGSANAVRVTLKDGSVVRVATHRVFTGSLIGRQSQPEFVTTYGELPTKAKVQYKEFADKEQLRRYETAPTEQVIRRHRGGLRMDEEQLRRMRSRGLGGLRPPFIPDEVIKLPKPPKTITLTSDHSIVVAYNSVYNTKPALETGAMFTILFGYEFGRRPVLVGTIKSFELITNNPA